MKHRIHARYAAAFLLISGILTILFGTQLYGLWMILKSCLYFAAKGTREQYILSVFGRHAGYGFVSIAVLLLSIFLVIVVLFFLSTDYGRKVGSEFGIMIRYLLEKFCLSVFLLLELICQLCGLSWHRKETRPPYPWRKDSVYRATQTAEIREYRFPSPESDSYGAFLRRLARISGTDEKIGYAYRTLCRIYNRDSGNLKTSDTPREVEVKVTPTQQLSEKEGREVREIIERAKFADQILTENEKQQLLGEICRIISGYLS